jgi:hypothetical protein
MATRTQQHNENEENGSVIPHSGPRTQNITIKPPRFEYATFEIGGKEEVPLVIHRFSAKLKQEMKEKMEAGKTASSKRDRSAKDIKRAYEEARYRHVSGWDGFHAAALRKAMISACRLVNFKMTLAKLSIFVVKEGVDKDEPQIPLVRIIGEPVLQEDMARVSTGEPYVTIRPAYHEWKARPRIRWDADQFTLADVTNLMLRVGEQVGIGEGRPDSKNSAGMDWGLFDVSQAVSGQVAA